ncbi:MAG: Lrp/AsnC family transcriptional regulator [Leptolyngbyaceae cyanobacterium MAG.088]|nr:Lrp/AsnC family transcriptional regulator [Leptolyngbyaceae cyanobacterium MAG.088]
MDATDRQIISLLRQNSRLSQEQIARAVNLSRPAIHERLKRLETKQVIRGYTTLINWRAIDLALTAFIWIGIDLTPCTKVFAEIKALSNDEILVEECHRVTGEWCLLLKIRTSSTESLQDFLDRLRAISGVKSTMTNIALSTLGEAL